MVSFELNIRSTFDTVQLPLGGVVLYRASHPGESSLENENGRRPGTVQDGARLVWGIFDCGLESGLLVGCGWMPIRSVQALYRGVLACHAVWMDKRRIRQIGQGRGVGTSFLDEGEYDEGSPAVCQASGEGNGLWEWERLGV